MTNPHNKGQVSTPDNPGNSPVMTWIRDHLNYDIEYSCLIWPFARGDNGYGSFGRSHTFTYAHRYICELVNGPAPSDEHQAAHSCGRGHHGCVNPKHLSWKTPAENQLDRRNHGTENRVWNKLKPEDVAEIRRLKVEASPATLASRFGVTEACIRQVMAGKTWKTGQIRYGGFKKGDPNNPSVRRAAQCEGN